MGGISKCGNKRKEITSQAQTKSMLELGRESGKDSPDRKPGVSFVP
jgi:hypothetical protein